MHLKLRTLLLGVLIPILVTAMFLVSFLFVFENELYTKSILSLNTSPDSAAIPPSQLDSFAAFFNMHQGTLFLSLGITAIASFFIAYLAYRISTSISILSKEVDAVAKLELESRQRIHSSIAEIRSIDTAVASMRLALRAFARYIPFEIAKKLMNQTHDITLGGETKKITIFFSDITDFTYLMEHLPIETINALLIDYFSTLSKIITECGGLIDKYMGDGLMSLWGAIDEMEDAPEKACTAALLAQHALASLNITRTQQKIPMFKTRMGIQLGPVIVGNFGTADRMNYSAIGDAVNIAFRLQELNKIYGTKIILAEEIVLATGSTFLIRPLDLVEMKGKKEKIKIFELIAQNNGPPEIAPTLDQVQLCSMFKPAYYAFERNHKKEAKQLFLEIQERFPNDLPTQLYLQKLRDC